MIRGKYMGIRKFLSRETLQVKIFVNFYVEPLEMREVIFWGSPTRS